ncbi:DUF4129 domain-containing protein [Halovivax cerinus]|uniref:DUF4129 domain-containing protein n=1 Tax=Halovivax cerinus TaxID=1487865 RepID=A0ABD5NN48_9EURY|nr:DUF4129 domain-containing protein [Halovivax cerinus]
MRFDDAFKGGLTVLGIVAIALVAAILDASLDVPSETGGAPASQQSGPVDPVVVPEIPLFVQVLALVVVACLAGVVVLYIVDEPMESLLIVVGIVLGVALILGVYTLFSIVGTGPGLRAGGSEPTATGIASSTEGQGGNVTAATLFAASLGGFFVVFLGTLVYVRWRGGETDRAATDEPDLDTDAPAVAVGAAAGRAATQLETTSRRDLENTIYRAWQEMTSLLPVESPDTTTPREFEAAAVDVGLERSDVSDLTDLFEAVRYGSLESTPTREEQAIDILRRIESRYGADDGNEVDRK